MKEVIEQYSPEYCRLLEAAYGEGMMSEGGEALALMFKDVSIQGKKALDIGSGLGGVAYYLAKEHDCQVTGLEINPWMVKEAEERALKEIKNKLDFVLSTSNDHLPFENDSFDVVYSRGVFCHIENKQGILNECYRILKPGGVLVVNDFLSSIKGKWGEHVKRLVELEGLPIYAETIDGYIEVLNKAQLKGTKVLNLTEKYALYNEEIVSRLKTSEKKEAFIHSFNEKLHAEAIEGYSAIAQAMQKSEGMTVQFIAHKENGLENSVHLESSLKNTLTRVYQLDEAASVFIPKIIQESAFGRVQSAENRFLNRGLVLKNTTPCSRIDFRQLSIPPKSQLLDHFGYTGKIEKAIRRRPTQNFNAAPSFQKRALLF
ncbi:MAG TPA: methyltransferase domain-containing protein [Chlamydiales bacterium]|nr:methyltransferase domain-containing protein [Chlamydiales bacterium]